MGIEPTYPEWKSGILPLNYIRKRAFLFSRNPIQIRLNAQTLQNLSACFLDKHNASPVE